MFAKRYCKNRFRALGQSTTEYAVLLAIVASALIAMQVYIKRGVQGRLREMSDQIADIREHYEPSTTQSDYEVHQAGQVNVRYDHGTSTTVIPQNWNDDGVARQGEETRRWGSESALNEAQ